MDLTSSRIRVSADIEVTFATRCARCETVAREIVNVPAGGVIPNPNRTPEGWHSLDGEPICPRHTITVEDLEE